MNNNIGECLKSCLKGTLIQVLRAAASTCCLSNHMLQDEWHLAIAYEDDQLSLLRENEVQNGTVLYMICNDEDVTQVICENGQFNPPMPLARCSNPLMPHLVLENQPNLCAYNLYLVGFYINCQEQSYFFPTYKVCFDRAKMRAVFTISEAYPFVHARPRDLRFDPDEIFTMDIFAAYNKRSIFGRFQTLLGRDQRFMAANEGDRRIDRGHLTPVGDFFMNNLIRSTFKMINVIPQFHTVNDGNWKQMEEWARNPIHTPSKVCSGALDWVLQLPNSEGQGTSIYLSENRIPIPLWTFKVVLNRFGVRTVFLQYNNIHDVANGPPRIPAGICNLVACPSTIRFQNCNLYGYSFCCEPNHFMTKVMPQLQGHC